MDGLQDMQIRDFLSERFKCATDPNPDAACYIFKWAALLGCHCGCDCHGSR